MQTIFRAGIEADDDDDHGEDDDEDYDEKLTCAGLLDVFDGLFQLHQALLVLGQGLQILLSARRNNSAKKSSSSLYCQASSYQRCQTNGVINCAWKGRRK